MGSRRGAVDIWGVDLLETWLVGDPGAGGGGDETWMICPSAVEARQLTLLTEGRNASAGA